MTTVEDDNLHVHFSERDTGFRETPRRKLESPPPPAEAERLSPILSSSTSSNRNTAPLFVPELEPLSGNLVDDGNDATTHVRFHPVVTETIAIAIPQDHVHFLEPDTDFHETPHRKLESPPPPPEVERLSPTLSSSTASNRNNAPMLVPETESLSSNVVDDATRVRFHPVVTETVAVAMPQDHVHFSEPDTDFHETSHRKLESPPPPPEAERLSPKLSNSTASNREVAVEVLTEPVSHSGNVADDDAPHVRFRPIVAETIAIEVNELPHVHFSDGNLIPNLRESESSSRRKLESPPPPSEVRSLSPSYMERMSELSGEKLVAIKGGEEDDPNALSSLLFTTPEKVAAPLLTSSIRSTMSGSSGSGTPRFTSKELRGNLTRRQTNRDPLKYYEITAVLGVGSMGSVAKVRKRQSAIGGSARKAVQDQVRREHQLKACFALPIVGGMFRYCLKGQMDTFSDTSSKDVASLNTSDWVIADDGTESSSSPPSMTFAMKSIHLSRCTDESYIDELKNEIEILKTLDHPHIVKAIETFEHRNQLFVIMELCSGGDLYARDPYTEDEAARIMSSILSAIAYMHSKGILHRDLKYENVLFVNESPLAEVKLIDFGLSQKFGNDELTEGVGTIYTMAPEVLKGKYTKQADLWSVGVLAYMLMSSQMPFYGRNRNQIMEQIMDGKYEYKGRRWKRISKAGKAFVDDLLVVDPDDRATSDEALKASWLNRRFGATVRGPHTEEVSSVKSSLIRFANYSKLRQVALMVVAHKSTSAEIGILRKIFQQYDTRNVGHLNYEEFKAAIVDAGYTDDDYQKIFNAVDLDGSGKIRYTEFLAATIEAHGAISEVKLAEAFDRLDSDDSGFISVENLSEMLGADFPKEDIEAIIKEAASDNDGQISYAEFLALWEDRRYSEIHYVITDIKVMDNELDSERSTTLSALSTDESDPDQKNDLVARANFIEQKMLSERNVTVADEKKHVFFSDQ